MLLPCMVIRYCRDMENLWGGCEEFVKDEFYYFVRFDILKLLEQTDFHRKKRWGIKMKISVQYATMIVKNLEESVRFYKEVMGFSEGYHVDLPFGGITIMNSSEGASVELIEAPQFPVGLYSVGTDVDNLEEVIEHVKFCGGTILGEIAPTSVGRQIFAEDPNGVRICLIEHTEEYKKKYMG